MDENKVLQMLKESAEEVTVPENLEADRQNAGGVPGRCRWYHSGRLHCLLCT